MRNSVFEKTEANAVIDRAIKSGRVSHAYLFHSEDVFYADEFAEYCAKKLLGGCDACGKCASCKMIEAKSHPDFFTFPTERGGKLLVDDANRIIEVSYLAPQEADKKVVLISQIDNMNVAAQNKLLKTLEEPPAFVVYLLTAANTERVLPTIMSRVTKIDLKEIGEDALIEELSSEGVERNKAAEIARLSRGRLLRARSLANSDNPSKLYECALAYLESLTTSRELQRATSKLMGLNDELKETLGIVQEMLGDMLLMKYNLRSDCAFERARCEKLSESFPTALLTQGIDYVSSALEKINFYVGANQVVDELTLGLLEVKNRCR